MIILLDIIFGRYWKCNFGYFYNSEVTICTKFIISAVKIQSKKTRLNVKITAKKC